MNRDLYALFGVSPTASVGELRRAYRAKARATHPDRAGRGSDAARTARMAELNAAYARLSDPIRRAEYDAERAAAAPTSTTGEAHASRPLHTAPPPFSARTSLVRRPSSLAPKLIDLVALPGAFIGYTLLPELSLGTTALAGAAWGALLSLAAGRLAARNGHLDAIAHRLRHR